MATMLNPNAIQKGSITKDMIDAPVLDAKQNITDESLATIAKTIVGAINEVYNGGLKDASIATSNIEDGAIIEEKLDTALTAKVNNNVKTVEQALTDAQIAIAAKNLKFRDDNGNFFADKVSYDAIAALEHKPSNSVFGVGCTGNTFNASSNIWFENNCENNAVGSNNRFNAYGSYCNNNVTGMNCSYNKFELGASDNVLGREVQGCIIRGSNNKIGDFFLKCIFECRYVEIKNSLVPGPQTIYAQHIHILSGVQGKSSTERLIINIPDEYLNSSRELIITTKRTDGGPSTPEDIIMYYADEVADKQNKQDNTLATTSKEVVGAINELFNGGVKDKSIEIGKLAQAVQDTLKMVGTNIKVLPAGTDLLSDNIEEGVHILLPTGSGTYPNFPYSMNLHPGATAILVKAGDSSIILGVDTSSSDELPLLLKRRNGGNWYGTSIYNKINSKLDASVGAVKTANLANGAVSSDKIADGAVISTKLSDFLQDKVKMVGMNVKVLPDGTDLLSEDLEEGIYVVDCSKMTNVPSSITKSAYDYALSLLIVDREHKRVMMFGPDTNSTKYPTCAYRHLVQKSWNNTPDSIYSKLMSLQLGVDDSVKKRDDNLATTSKEVIGAINEIFNGGVKDTSISGAKLEDAAVTSTKIAARTIIGDNIQNKTIRTEQIADNAITTENINDYAVTSNKIKDGSITGYKIPNETILERHLGYWSVTKNKIAEGVVSLDKLAFSVQDTLKMVGTNVKEISYKSMGDKIPNIDDITETGIYILPNGEKYDGSTYSALPVDLRYSNVKLLIVSPTSQSGSEQRQTLIAINNSSLVGICTREAYDSTGFVNLPFSYTPIQSAIEGKIDNTSTLTDAEINDIWDNN